MLLNFCNSKLINFIIPVLLFCMIVSSGCVTSGIDTVDSEELESEHKYITEIINIKLKTGEIFTDKEYNFSLSLNDKDDVKIYLYPKPVHDTLNINSNIKRYESYLLQDILSAKVKFKNKPTVTGYIAGGVVLIGLLAFLWWANGERNKRP
jgi:hypothetical protein